MSAAARTRTRRSRQHAEEHENHERWMVTYADMLTLLLVLFIVLYAISQVNTSKFDELKSGLASAFKNGQPSVLTAGSGIVGGESMSAQQQIGPKNPIIGQSQSKQSGGSATALADAAQREVDQFSQIEKSIKASLRARGLDGTAMFTVDERGLVVTVLTDELVFAGNSAELEPEGAKILDAVARPLTLIDNKIQVDGHTNQQNVSTAPYPSGWELSSARASAVVRYLISEQGMSAARLSAAGYSDQRPLLPPSDPRSIVRNRRVDVVVLSKLPLGAASQLPALGKTLNSGN
ncbi:MAG: chemotaxis protein MotB [Pseudonocardiales bacterium]|jgi:chemotaxis protein MotB|nr:chemotaxis protein MotB [Pseudonocardiales bacterium]